jgi:FixJ family two-component response regulator
MLEIAAPNPDALSDLQRIASDRRETPVIATSNHGSIPFAVQAIRAGAVEFLVKPLVDDVVLTAVARAIRQSESILQKEAELIEIRTRYESLSQREREVLARVVAGELNKRVGAALGISEITVKAHRGRVMRKMRAHSLADLVRMAVRLRIPAAPAGSTPKSPSSRMSRRVGVSGGRMSQPIRIMPAASSHHVAVW